MEVLNEMFPRKFNLRIYLFYYSSRRAWSSSLDRYFSGGLDALNILNTVDGSVPPNLAVRYKEAESAPIGSSLSLLLAN